MNQKVTTHMLTLVGDMCPGSGAAHRLRHYIEYKMSEPTLWSELIRQTSLLFGGSMRETVPMAALGELIVLALDIIDDLQDRDNPEMPWAKCPEKEALQAAQLLLHVSLSKLHELTTEMPSSAPVVRHITEFLLRAFNGQYRDITNQMATEADYFEIVEEKSASLVIICSLLGYLCRDKPQDSEIEALIELSSYLGISAQMDNDARDVVRFDVKNDLFQCKKTLPVMYLLMKAPERFPLLLDYYERRVTREELLSRKAELIAFIESTHCLTYTKLIQQLYVQKVLGKLEQLVPDAMARERYMAATVKPLLQA